MPFIETALPDIQAWTRHFAKAELPVLARTSATLTELGKNLDDLSPRDIADVVADDPLMSLKVLAWAGKRLAQNMRATHSSLGHALETVETAIVCTGIAPFFRQFHKLETIESRLAPLPKARLGLLRVVKRSLVAADFARDWASYRNDMDIQIIAEAAMLHDVAEMIVWVYAPQLSLKMQMLQQASPHLRTADIQKSVLGVTFNELEVAIMEEWCLSSLMKKLTDDTHADNPQVRNVVLAANLARHLANGVDDPALPDDFTMIGELLRNSPDWVRERVMPETVDDMPQTQAA